jgi:hypothetical protein
MIKDNKQKKTLSIRISTNGFCFCTYIKSQPGSLKYFTYQPDVESSMASNLQAAFESAPLIRLQEDEYEIKAIIETGEYTCIPAEYDNTEEYKQFFNYCFPKSENAEVIANKLNAYGQTILFPVDAGVYETLQKYGNITFYTPASIIMSYLSYKPIEKEQYMLAYLYNDYAFILTMKNGKVGMSNIFKKEEKENTLFYMLSIWKEQGLSQSEDYLYLCGDNSIEAFSPIAGQFIKNIKRINPNELFSPSLLNRTEGIPFDLQALILCE